MNEGKFPIVIDGELCGAVEIAHRGAATVFSARCRMTDEVLRLSVYGGDGEGYIGVMAPEGDELRLERALSRSAMRGFPENVTFASRAGASCAAAGGEKAAPPASETSGETARLPCEETRGSAESGCSDGVCCSEEPISAPPERSGSEEAPLTAEISDDGLHWYSSPDGILVTNDSGRCLAAIPDGDSRMPQGTNGRPRLIEGRKYTVFAVDGGRLADFD